MFLPVLPTPTPLTMPGGPPVDDMDKQTLDRMRRLMEGNGYPPLDRRLNHLEDRTSTIERAMFYNPDTKEPGIVADVKAIRSDARVDREERRLFEAKLWTAVRVFLTVTSLGVLAGTARVVASWLGGS